MKLIISFLFASLFILDTTFAQNVPMGMKYQAVARDAEGQVMTNQVLRLNIKLYSASRPADVLYEEAQEVTTNEGGLFTLTIGEGAPLAGTFEKIPWSDYQIWMEVAVKPENGSDYVTISNSQMLSVPYAFHAATASEFVGNGQSRGSTNDPYTKIWNTLGNTGTNPVINKLGTTDLADLVIVTANTERMRINTEGHVFMQNDLSVKRNVYLNTYTSPLQHPAYEEMGETINNGDFTVENGSMTHLTGDLQVDQNADIDGNTTINGNTTIDGLTRLNHTEQSIDTSTGALVTKGGVGIAKNLNVGGTLGLTGDAIFFGKVRIKNTTESTDKQSGALVVDGGVGIGQRLNVGGETKINDHFFVETSDTGFVASIINKDNGHGDGLIIKLGKTHPTFKNGQHLHVPSPGTEFASNAVSIARGWLEGEAFELEDILDFMPTAWYAGSACNLFNTLRTPILDYLDLPVTTRDIAVGLNGHDPVLCEIKEMIANNNGNVDWDDLEVEFDDWAPAFRTEAFKTKLINDANQADCPSCWDNDTHCTGLDGLIDDDDLYYDVNWATIFPPQLDLNFLGVDINDLEIPSLPCPDYLPSIQMPVLSFLDVPNSLTTDNQFISFRDSEDRELGSIRAQSVVDWEQDYLSSNLVPLVSAAIGLDIVNDFAAIFSGFTTIADAYNSIGVEYASGNGDYAEWLERIHHEESINQGDIVGVSGGKITKDLKHAEQVMAVSGKPIMLGNVPTPEMEEKGNKIAFMGQIPVKIIGPVQSGDYIVGNASTPGYGLAVNPQDLRQDHLHLVVGRAWETNLNNGPKMINTVIGVDNGNFIKIMKDNQAAVNVLQARVNELESKYENVMASVDMLLAEKASTSAGHRKGKENR